MPRSFRSYGIECCKSPQRAQWGARKLASLIAPNAIKLPVDSAGRNIKAQTLFATESEVYAFLLAGKSPQSEPFRRWVTEEVLPTIRKTGSYNAEESTNPALDRAST